MKTKSFIYIVLAGLLWGTSGIFVNILAPYGFSSLQMTFLRVMVSFISIFIYILFFHKSVFKTNIKELLLFACGGVCLFATSACYYASMQLTSIATAVILMYTAPIFVMVFSVMFFDEKFTRLKAAALVCMIIGCALVSGVVGGLKINIPGVMLGLLSGVSYSAYNIFTKLQMRRKSHPLKATLYCFLFATIVAFIISEPFGIVEYIPKNPAVILPLGIGIGICTCVLPYLLYTIALKNLPVGTAAALGILEPMSATVFGVLIFKEPLTFFSIVGIVLILGAVYMLSKSDN